MAFSVCRAGVLSPLGGIALNPIAKQHYDGGVQFLQIPLRSSKVQAALPASPSLQTSSSSFLGHTFSASSPTQALRRQPAVRDNPVKCSVAVEAPAAADERPFPTLDARLVLEDGSVWEGQAFGARGTQVGEVVFNTSMTGYQEILTDPSYSGQFVLMTTPHIGNTGINLEDEESEKCYTGGLIIRSLSPMVSNWRSTKTLPEYLEEKGVMGIAEVDTRAITKRLRINGSLIGVLSTDASIPDDELIKQAQGWKIVGVDLITPASTKRVYEWKDKTGDEWEFAPEANSGPDTRYSVVAYDFGVKHNILRRLTSYGCRITVVPSTTPAEEVLAMNPEGVLFSNGPGDPSAVPYAVENVKGLLGQVPVFGICMGHQLLGQAFGGTTFKMKFGHHGGNHPVRQVATGRVEISAQNHNYAVDTDSLPDGVEITHINLNDGTCAGMVFPAMQAMSIQYHPEASPGPHDSDPCFADFVKMMEEARAKKA
ncbi:Multifunctional pyrimidine synthesis protein CAD [Klebsormidium nitens]|uniref:Carbamoyl phosphate synthase small chain, chloroplastic n=1 Tax=Klebsormidium nitens TaxID=105231 RepID=A0A1Y1HR88_KLENI|nr:Multifunctional pyrimidine synthesis protein CAD [Klebsormidium nitens]|eukprot:GAQ81155.1 Multifunctional pyrimidine synthesis protein CAD [Klebsormidium nitens]